MAAEADVDVVLRDLVELSPMLRAVRTKFPNLETFGVVQHFDVQAFSKDLVVSACVCIARAAQSARDNLGPHLLETFVPQTVPKEAFLHVLYALGLPAELMLTICASVRWPEDQSSGSSASKYERPQVAAAVPEATTSGWWCGSPRTTKKRKAAVSPGQTVALSPEPQPGASFRAGARAQVTNISDVGHGPAVSSKSAGALALLNQGLTGQALLDKLRSSLIGEGLVLPNGPFGPRRMLYADWTASGRGVRVIEEFMCDKALPLYANTHTEASATGAHSTRLREEARSACHAALGGEDDVGVIFCGSGATTAINKMVTILGLRLPAQLEDRYQLSSLIPPEDRPVVFVGPYEHHSNEIPWRESIADVVPISEDKDGHICLVSLDKALLKYATRPLKIGSFSAASNVTGIRTDVAAVSSVLHKHGALAFWDFAAAGPYVDMNMKAQAGQPGSHMDAVFISPHKFPGGPGTPGILGVRKGLLTNRVPSVPGGGTVSYVNTKDHEYLTDVVHREEGGTPAIVESMRAGLVFALKSAIGCDVIHAAEQANVTRALAAWTAHPRIRILGSTRVERLAIVSFTIKRGGERSSAAPVKKTAWEEASPALDTDMGPDPGQGRGYIHHNLVTGLLNDLFGIQARGGCSCAGPYGHRLLGIDEETSRAFQRAIATGYEGLKPGWARVSFHYTMTPAAVDYMIRAVLFLADHAWRFLPEYSFDPHTGLWKHRSAEGAVKARGQASIAEAFVFPSAGSATSGATASGVQGSGGLPYEVQDEAVLPSYLDQARTLASKRPVPRLAAYPVGHFGAPQRTASASSLASSAGDTADPGAHTDASSVTTAPTAAHTVSGTGTPHAGLAALDPQRAMTDSSLPSQVGVTALPSPVMSSGASVDGSDPHTGVRDATADSHGSPLIWSAAAEHLRWFDVPASV